MTSPNSNSAPALRVLDSDIGKVAPVADIADLIGYSQSGIWKAMKAYEEKISPYKTFLTLPTAGGPQRFACLNRQGMDYLFAIIHPSKAKMPLDELLEFRRSVLSRLGTDTPLLPAPAASSLETDIAEAKQLSALCERPVDSFLAVVLRKHGKPEFADAISPAAGKLPSIIQHGTPGTWFKPTQLGQMCGNLSAEQVNWWLHNHGFQYKDGSIWRLCPAGEIHGEEYVFETEQGHKEIRIRWRQSVLYASGLKRDIPASQAALPARAGVML